MKLKAHVFACLIIILSSLPVIVEASLLISPTRVVLGDRDRGATVTLINSADKVKSYRLEWVDMMAMPAGGYRELTESERQTYPGISKIARLSPKQVTLAPGQQQTVRIAVRRPRGMLDGDYRSQLKFTALPDEDEDNSVGVLRMQMRMLMSYTIPVVLHQGELNANVSIQNIELYHERSKNKTVVRASISRSGLHSVTGDLIAYWTPAGQSNEKEVGRINGYNIFAEISNAETVINLLDFTPGNGTLKLIYRGKQEFLGTTLSESSYNINRNQFVLVD